MAKHISVKGVVQGVGFRPFVYGLATRLNLHGWVCATSGGAEILVQGPSLNVEKFIHSIKTEAPSATHIEDVTVVDESINIEYATFDIRPSTKIIGSYQPISADIGICPDCERELFNPRDRRYLYPFVSCMHCGPRFSIIIDTPYDRLNTTMADFPMCEHCRAEYADPFNRRFHAQTLACPDCGPFVELRETHSQFPSSHPRVSSIEIRVSAILKARRLLREGYIVAIKGPGGFQLACDASNPYTVAELRDRRGRIDKAFVVMAANVTAVAAVCHLQKAEQLLLTSAEKPVVLLTRKQQSAGQGFKVSELVAPNLDTLGVVLPYTAMHHLLLNQTDPVLAREPVPPILVMTDGSCSGEPIAIDNQDALERLSPLADAFLLHNREIHMGADDSVVRVDQNNRVYLRRSRGYAPYMIELPFAVKPTLAVGDKLESTFCLAHQHHAFLSQHIGNMENAATRESFERSVQHLSQIFQIEPKITVHDLHPNYSTALYMEHAPSDHPDVGIQHHHAHIASCMADNGLENRQLIGLCFDRTGYGTDSAIWGGEAFLASYSDFARFAHLEYLPLPGKEVANWSPWRIAVRYAHALGMDIDHLPFLQNIDKQAIGMVRHPITKGVESPMTSSMGFLFDAVASLIGIRNDVTYEGQTLSEMEVLSKAFISLAKPYPYIVDETKNGVTVRLKELLSAIVADVRANESVGMMGARFHKTTVEIAIAICKRVRARTDLNEVVLSGDIWQNQVLLDLVRQGLRQEEFIVYFHKQVPTNDGGLALGQAVIANFQRPDHAEREERAGNLLLL